MSLRITIYRICTYANSQSKGVDAKLRVRSGLGGFAIRYSIFDILVLGLFGSPPCLRTNFIML